MVENRKISISRLYLASHRGRLRRNLAKMFDTHKTRMIGLLCGEAVSIQYRNVTDRQTDRQNCYINIARQCAEAR